MSLADETVSKIARQTVRCYADVSALCEDVPMLRNLGGTTLVKGSRGIQLEKAAEAIRQL
jgi:UDP-N-acetylmuramyl pentapeptide synthase